MLGQDPTDLLTRVVGETHDEHLAGGERGTDPRHQIQMLIAGRLSVEHASERTEERASDRAHRRDQQTSYGDPRRCDGDETDAGQRSDRRADRHPPRDVAQQVRVVVVLERDTPARTQGDPELLAAEPIGTQVDDRRLRGGDVGQHGGDVLVVGAIVVEEHPLTVPGPPPVRLTKCSPHAHDR
jgi:hypothetical protein